MAHHSFKQAACANCHHAFVAGAPDEFCPRCGQQNHAVDISFGHVVEEFLEGIFHFDGKVFNTAKLLLFKPGELTRRFLAGHRVPYVPPIRLYVFISFVFFLILSLQTASKADKHRKPMAEVAAAVDSLNVQTDSLSVAGAKQAAVLTMGSGQDPALQTTAGEKGSKRSVVKLLGLTFDKDELARLPDDMSAAEVDSVLLRNKRPVNFLNRLALRRAVRWHHATSEEIKNKGLRALSLTMFLLMPLAALLLKGFYLRQQRYYLGHLIFTIHLHCFMFLFFGALLLLNKVPVVREAVDWLWWVPAPYFVLALRRAYGQSWGKTLFKTFMLSITYWFVLVLSFVLVASLGVAFF